LLLCRWPGLLPLLLLLLALRRLLLLALRRLLLLPLL